jgi:quercetin dioxygenase-like cupin family protein
MSRTAGTTGTKNAGAHRADAAQAIFDLPNLQGMATGPGYSTALGGVVEGRRTQVGLMRKARGTGARPHSHPNEQWNYVLQGQLRVSIKGQPDRICGPGTLIYFAPDVVHATVALPEEDVVFFVVKDMTHGIIGRAADGAEAGGHFEEGFAPR